MAIGRRKTTTTTNNHNSNNNNNNSRHLHHPNKTTATWTATELDFYNNNNNKMVSVSKIKVYRNKVVQVFLCQLFWRQFVTSPGIVLWSKLDFLYIKSKNLNSWPYWVTSRKLVQKVFLIYRYNFFAAFVAITATTADQDFIELPCFYIPWVKLCRCLHMWMNKPLCLYPSIRPPSTSEDSSHLPPA